VSIVHCYTIILIVLPNVVVISLLHVWKGPGLSMYEFNAQYYFFFARSAKSMITRMIRQLNTRKWSTSNDYSFIQNNTTHTHSHTHTHTHTHTHAHAPMHTHRHTHTHTHTHTNNIFISIPIPMEKMVHYLTSYSNNKLNKVNVILQSSNI
jgi:ABC-type Zn2+ transport system substrate-binding protein/surface adhesin